ncbi:hypothetical protein ACFJGW_00605 [Burkholderiaceae bacterium UC74_6]
MLIKRIPAGQGFERVTEAVASDYGSLIDLVQRAIRDVLRGTSGGDSYYISTSAIWPDRIVVQINGRYQSYPYTLSAENVVSLGAPSEVVLGYTPVREAAAAAPEGAVLREAADGSIEVTIAKAGLSANRNYYSDSVLREAVALFEGVRVFAKSDADHTKGAGKDVRGLIGGIYNVRFVEGAGSDEGSLVGIFRPIDPTDPVVTKMTEAVKRGMQGLMGLSLDADATTATVKRGKATVREAKKFVKVHSVDLIVEPGAGGGLDRLTEATSPSPSNSEDFMKSRYLLALTAIAPLMASALAAAAPESQVLIRLQEACSTNKLDFGAVLSAADGAKGETEEALTQEIGAAMSRLAEAAKASSQPGSQRVTEATANKTPLTQADMDLWQARQHAVTAIASCNLPQITKDRLNAHFKTLERFTEAQVDETIKAEREYLGRLTESGRPTGGMPRIELGDRTTQVEDMLNAFFDPAHKDHKRVQSFRECYLEITGDREFTGRPNLSRLTESIGTDTFANVLGNSITRRLIQAYNEAVQWQTWRKVATAVGVNDFRVQERTAMGGYGNLPIVAERGAYTALTDPSDAKATYAVAKRGGLASVSLEAIRNDDVSAIRRIPLEQGRAAARTLYNFVFNFFAANAAIYDGVALFHATHNNLFTGALSASELAVHRLAMKKQPGRDTGNRMGIGPSLLLVPDDLEQTSVDLFSRNTNLDKTFVQSLAPTIIPVATWTDTNDWVTLADPNDIPVLEIGFLDGEDPTMLVQDSPTAGSVFTNDMITYKLRHTYGGNVLPDGFKGATKAVVP